eukprot:363670-Chlamydomonas_euryale.AAC.30
MATRWGRVAVARGRGTRPLRGPSWCAVPRPCGGAAFTRIRGAYADKSLSAQIFTPSTLVAPELLTRSARWKQRHYNHTAGTVAAVLPVACVGACAARDADAGCRMAWWEAGVNLHQRPLKPPCEVRSLIRQQPWLADGVLIPPWGGSPCMDG